MKKNEGTTYGYSWMYKVLVAMLRSVSIKAVYAFMALFAVPFSMLLSRGSRPTFRYYRHHRHYGRWQSVVALYRNFYLFGQTVVDKFAMYAGHRFDVTYHGFEHAHDRPEDAPSILLLSAHIGCSEILGYSFHFKKTCNVLVYGGEKQSVMEYREISFGSMNIRMIPVGTRTSHSDAILRAIDNGETIISFADRFANAGKVIASTLHGSPVYLARGPFAMAVTRSMDTYMVCAMKEPDGSYSAYLTALPYDKTLPPKQQRQQLADAYTAAIERQLEQYPLQWFNFSDIWKEPVSGNAQGM